MHRKCYQPVSNLPECSKLLERVILRQLVEHVMNNNLLEERQSSYHQFHETALLCVTKNDIVWVHLEALSLTD